MSESGALVSSCASLLSAAIRPRWGGEIHLSNSPIFPDHLSGIGGEYAAVNSAIQELIPARLRGTTDLCVNGTFWAGAAIGAVAALVVLDPAIIDPEIGWRAAFVVGGALSAMVLLLRRYLPESPRWLMTHGRLDEAESVVAGIEAWVQADTGRARCSA